MKLKHRLNISLLIALLTLSGCASIMVPTGRYLSVADKQAFLKSVNTGSLETFALLGLYLWISQPKGPPSETEMKEKWVPAGVQHWVRANFARGKEARDFLELRGIAIQDLYFNKANNDQLYRPALTLAYFCDHAGGTFQHQPGSEHRLGPLSDFKPRYPNSEYRDYPFIRTGEAADAYRQIKDANEHHAFGTFHCTRPDGSVQWVATVTLPETFMRTDFFSIGIDRTSNWTVPVSVTANETQFERPQTYSTVHLKVMAERAAQAGVRHREQYGEITFEAWPLSNYDRYDCRQVASKARQGDVTLNSSIYRICKA